MALAERLAQALNGTSSEKICTKVSIAVGRNIDNRNCQFTTATFALRKHAVNHVLCDLG